MSESTETYTALHFIGGEEVSSATGRSFETINPATGERLASVAFAEIEDVDKAVRAAARAFDVGLWRHLAPTARARCLRKIAQLIRERRDEIAHLDSVDSGKPITDARNDVDAAAALLDYASSIPENLRGSVFPQDAGFFSYSRRAPYGVVGAIAPWNFPFLNAVAKTALPMAVGNSVVLKMAEQTPLSTSLYAQICTEAGLPSGVLNVVHGDGPTTGAALVAHPDVPKITFTGSTDTGRAILAVAARNIKSCHLELGGKSPNIVLPDADFDQAVAGSLFASFWNSGQVCSSGSRLIVHEDVADEFLATLSTHAQALTLGDPLAETTQLGPLVSKEQLQRVNTYIDRGVQEGASLVLAGSNVKLPAPHDLGFFVGPTIFADVQPMMSIAKEEIFGPVLSVLRFRTDREAVELANDSDYGLAATVWTSRIDRAFTFANMIDAGIIWTNCPHKLGWHIPYEGDKQSGLGEDQGTEAISTFTKLKVHNLNFAASSPCW